MQASKKTAKYKSGIKKSTSPVAGKTTTTTSFFTESRIQYLVILVISLLIYSNTLFFNFALDDGLMITDNKVTKKGFSGLGEIFTKNSFYGVFGDKANQYLPGGRYRPLSQAMFAVEYQIFGMSPFVGHFFNILLFSLLCLLLLKVLKMIFEKYDTKPWYLSLPFIATLLFACHPLHTEVVANIKGRDELLSFLGSLATLYFSFQYFKNGKLLNLLLIFLFFSLALLSKENAVTFLAIVPLSLFFAFKGPVKKHLFVLLPMILSVAVYFALRVNALGFITNTVVNKDLLNDPFLFATPAGKYATIFLTWGKYLLLVLVPHPLTHDYYPYQVALTEFSDFRVLLSIAVYLALIVFSLIRIRNKDIFAYAVLFFLITFSISSNIVFNIGTFMNERFMFAPLLGFTIAVAYLINKYLNKKHLMLSAKIILIALISMYSLKTFSRNFAWKDSFILFTTDVKTSVNSAKVNVGAGEVLLKSVNEKTPEPVRTATIEKAIGYIKKGVQIYPGFTSGWVYLGWGQRMIKDYEGSRASLEHVLMLDSTNNDAISYLNSDAISCYQAGNFKQAEENFKTLIRYVPEHTEYEYLLAEVYANTNKVDSALVLLNDILLKNPSYDKAYNKLGEIYGRIFNNFDKSFEYLHKAYDLNPTNIETLRNLGTAYGLQRDFQKSLKYLLEAEKVNPSDKDILNKLSLTYLNLGNIKLAEEYAGKAKGN
ncbi:MAG TPA: tetratricopeptide repeat protein [Bacteroidales bacterium]|nr:tetratricopeptide repeat protein [Bacteroidales bacterium]